MDWLNKNYFKFVKAEMEKNHQLMGLTAISNDQKSINDNLQNDSIKKDNLPSQTKSPQNKPLKPIKSPTPHLSARDKARDKKTPNNKNQNIENLQKEEKLKN